jgi:hypothetical protein
MKRRWQWQGPKGHHNEQQADGNAGNTGGYDAPPAGPPNSNPAPSGNMNSPNVAPSGNTNNPNNNAKFQSSPSANSNTKAQKPSNSGPTPTPTGKTGSGNSKNDPVSGNLPAGGSAGGAPAGNDNLYVDPKNIPASMSVAASYAGFTNTADWTMQQRRSLDDDDADAEADADADNEAPEYASTDDIPVSNRPAADEEEADSDDDESAGIKLNAPVAVFGKREPEPESEGVSDNQHGKARAPMNDKERGEWRKKMAERLGKVGQRRAAPFV